MEGGAWWATVHGVAKSRTRLSDFTQSLGTKIQKQSLYAATRLHTTTREKLQTSDQRFRGSQDNTHTYTVCTVSVCVHIQCRYKSATVRAPEEN